MLARLRTSEYEDKVHQAESQTAAAAAAAQKGQLDFDRATRLFASGSLTKPDYDAARAQHDATQAQWHGAQAFKSEAAVALHDTVIATPISGDIVKKAVEVGSLVGPGTLAFAVAATDQVKVLVGVPDVVVNTLKIGLPVVVTVEALPGRTFNARITRIASAADPQTRDFDVEVAIPNGDHALKAGMIATLQFDGGSHPSSAPAVPISAVVQAPSGSYGVFVIEETAGESVARLRPVSLGAVHGASIEVRQGLAAGDRIVTTGANILKDGQRVEVLK